MILKILTVHNYTNIHKSDHLYEGAGIQAQSLAPPEMQPVWAGNTARPYDLASETAGGSRIQECEEKNEGFHMSVSCHQALL